MSFGDLSGCDYWRCKARTQQVRFLESPASHGKSGGFSVLNHYLKTDSSEVLATEKADYQFCEVPHGYRLQWSSEFRAIDKDIVFGDQEEMGLGVRMVSSLAEKRGQGEEYSTATIASVRNKCGENLWSGATPPAVFMGDGSESP